MKINKVKTIKELKYLKSYSIEYLSKSGKEKVWEIASRSSKERLINEVIHKKSYTDGTMIFATDKTKSKVVILREYRVSAGGYMYMLPAGLVEENEDIEDAAIREFKEETGLLLDPLYTEKERYVSVGITNERVNVVYGYFSGKASKAYQEDNEDADILFIGKDEAIRLLKEEEVSIRSAMLLQNFFKIHPFFDQE